MTVAYRRSYLGVLSTNPDAIAWQIEMPDGSIRYYLGDSKAEVRAYVTKKLGVRPLKIQSLGTLENALARGSLPGSDDGLDYMVRGDLEPYYD